MSVQIEDTANPKIKKFIFEDLLTRKGVEYKKGDSIKDSEILSQIMQFPFIEAIMVSGNFVGIQINESIDWEDIQDDIVEIFELAIKENKRIIEPKNQNTFAVYAEVTPNPNVSKFVTNKLLVTEEFEFSEQSDKTISPLANRLFELPYVKQVFLNQNYVSVTKSEDSQWNEITFELREIIGGFLRDGGVVLLPGAVQEKEETTPHKTVESQDPISQQIQSILDEYVRPAVAGDGGNIQFIEYTPSDKKVSVLLQGACSGCPSSTITLKNGIENMLKEMLPDSIEEVVAING